MLCCPCKTSTPIAFGPFVSSSGNQLEFRSPCAACLLFSGSLHKGSHHPFCQHVVGLRSLAKFGIDFNKSANCLDCCELLVGFRLKGRLKLGAEGGKWDLLAKPFMAARVFGYWVEEGLLAVSY